MSATTQNESNMPVPKQARFCSTFCLETFVLMSRKIRQQFLVFIKVIERHLKSTSSNVSSIWLNCQQIQDPLVGAAFQVHANNLVHKTYVT